MATWTFLTHHAHVLLEVAKNPDATVLQIAVGVGISTRSTVTILGDLADTGYLERERRGRRNHYSVVPSAPLRHPSNAGHTVGTLISALAELS